MSEVVALQTRAEREYAEYVRLVAVMNADPTISNATAAARQWWRFMAEYDVPSDDASIAHKKLEPRKL